MFVRNVYVKKEYVKYCPSSFSTKEALELLRKTGFRCIPVVDENTDEYKGQIYKVHILEHLFENGGKEEDSVLSVVTEKDAVVRESTSLISTLRRIDRLPFLSVVDEKERFTGIVTHSVVMDLFRDGFGMNTGGYCFTIAIGEYAGALKRIIEQIRGFNIEALQTFDNGNTYVRRLSFTISADSEHESEKIEKKLDDIGVRILHVEKLEKQ